MKLLTFLTAEKMNNMNLGKKFIWGGLGWVLGGPIGAILGVALASMTDGQPQPGGRTTYPRTRPGDFMVSLLVLFAVVMKADRKMLKTELDYIKRFLTAQFPHENTRVYLTLFKDILDQSYPLRDVCRQIQRSMDHASRLELIHVLFGLAAADGEIHRIEIDTIKKIAGYLNVSEKDFVSIRSMFVKDPRAAYRILEIDESSTDTEIKKAYRKMANKYHPDKVAHLGVDLQKLAEEKFKAVNDAYREIKKERALT